MLRGRPVAYEALRHRSVLNLEGYRRLSSTSSCVTAPDSVQYDQGLPLGEPFSYHTVCFTSKRTLFDSTEDFWNAMLSLMKREPEGTSRLENSSRNVEPSTLACCEATMHAPLEESLGVVRVRVQETWMETEETKAPESISRDRYRAAFGLRSFDGHNESRIYLSSEIDCLT
jgi:hypothetical protein